MNNRRKAVVTILSALVIVTVPAVSRAASVGLGASVWCAWWDASVMDYTARFGSGRGEMKPAAAGGPILTVQFNDTWGMSLTYLYGKFEMSNASLLSSSFNIGRHDLDFIVSAAVHKYVRLFFGGKYWGYQGDISTKFLFLSYGTSVLRHQGGPGIGLGLSLPLGAGFYLLPNISAVFTFGTVSPSSGGIIGMITDFIKVSEYTTMYYGLNSTLSLAYHIEKANLALVLGGRFQYLWLYFIDIEENADYHDMFGGITFSAMYMFNIPGQGKKG